MKYKIKYRNELKNKYFCQILNYYCIFKFLLLLIIIKGIEIYFKIRNEDYLKLNNNYSLINKKFNLIEKYNIKKEINIGIYAFSIKNGGRARFTSLLINYLAQIKIFKIVLFIRTAKQDDEYKLPNNIKRILVDQNLINKIKKNKIHIFIYQLSFSDEIKILNNVTNIKIIFYQHLGIFDWIYGNYTIFKNLYREYMNSKYIINIIPYENVYIFKQWGMQSIYMNNFMTYEFDKIFPSYLSSKTILMIGRGDAKKKRFPIGIEAMEYIKEEIHDIEMIIISDLFRLSIIKSLINNLNLEPFIKFEGYIASPEIYFKNISLNLFPSISEAFPLVLCETKIYGIPSILLGLDYTTISEGGTIIIYDDSPESLAKATIEILRNKNHLFELGKQARNSMKIFNNDNILTKWIKSILSLYYTDKFDKDFNDEDNKLSEIEAINILKRQVNLLKKRIPIFENANINDFLNFTYMENII